MFITLRHLLVGLGSFIGSGSFRLTARRALGGDYDSDCHILKHDYTHYFSHRGLPVPVPWSKIEKKCDKDKDDSCKDDKKDDSCKYYSFKYCDKKDDSCKDEKNVKDDDKKDKKVPDIKFSQTFNKCKFGPWLPVGGGGPDILPPLPPPPPPPFPFPGAA
jgi:hypothetical protein